MSDEEHQNSGEDDAYARALVDQQLAQERQLTQDVDDEERRRREHRLFAAQITAPHPTGEAAKRRPPKVPLSPMKRLQPKFNPMADWANYVVVFLGGCLGTALRVLMWNGAPVDDGFWGPFSIGTLIANLVACFLFSALVTFCAQAIWIRKRVRQLTSRAFGMGVCGAMSSMSSIMIENMVGLTDGDYVGAFTYSVGSMLLGIVVAIAGAWIVTKLTAARAARAMTEVFFEAKPAIGVRVPMPTDRSSSSVGNDRPHMTASEPDPITDELPRIVRDSDPGHDHGFWHGGHI